MWLPQSHSTSTGSARALSARRPTVFSAMRTGETLHLTERFTRVNDDTLLYEYTVEDQTTFTRPFTVAIHMRKSDEPMFEYVCHEGNYGLLNILRGARAAEAESERSR